MDMLPVDFPFIITPELQSGVKVLSPAIAILENYPNPASGKTTVHFRIPAQAHASVRIYDALGRMVCTLMQGMINPIDQNIQLSTIGFMPGEYTLELLVPELGISEHRKLIIIE